MFYEGKANYVVEVTRNSRQKKLRSSFEDMERGLGRGVEVEIDRNKCNTVGQNFTWHTSSIMNCTVTTMA